MWHEKQEVHVHVSSGNLVTPDDDALPRPRLLTDPLQHNLSWPPLLLHLHLLPLRHNDTARGPEPRHTKDTGLPPHRPATPRKKMLRTLLGAARGAPQQQELLPRLGLGAALSQLPSADTTTAALIHTGWPAADGGDPRDQKQSTPRPRKGGSLGEVGARACMCSRLPLLDGSSCGCVCACVGVRVCVAVSTPAPPHTKRVPASTVRVGFACNHMQS